MTGNLRLVFIFVLVAIWLLILIPIQLLGLVFYTPLAGQVPVIFHRGVLKLFGVRVKCDGHLSRSRPLLIVANHVSWLDIVVLGAVAPLSFVAKSEMANWPLFGQLARLQRTIFIQRERRRTTNQQAGKIGERMTANEVIVLFPEGTTSDGNMLLPFKTPLFEAAKFALVSTPMEHAQVQPVALHYTRLHGLPLGRAKRSHVSWPGDIGLAESLLSVAKTGALDVVIKFGEPIILTETSNRKAVAAEAHLAIRRLFER